jgi:cyclopropane fatty-acyl-phospholipid synthase-like methyltransferase
MNQGLTNLSGDRRSAGTLGRAAAKFRDWWDGRGPFDVEEREPTPTLPAPRPSKAASQSPPVPAGPQPRMTPEKLALATKLWGEGFYEPLGKSYVPDLVKPFALNEKVTVLDLGAGLGGGTRAVAERYKVWITGMEPDADFAATAMQLSVKAGMKTRAPIAAYDIEKLSLPPRKYNAVFAKETFYRAQNKRGLLGAIAHGMANDGQVLFTDFVLRKPGHVTGDIAAWLKADTFVGHPWSGAETTSALNELKFDTRIDEDMTPRYRRAALSGWHACLEELSSGKRPPRPVLLQLLNDAELWMHRLHALETGDLQVRRYHAILKRK